MLAPSTTVKKLIAETNLQVDGTVPRIIAVRDLSILKDKLIQDQLAPELAHHENPEALNFLQDYKVRTIEHVESLIKSAEHHQGVKIEQLVEVTIRSSLVFQASIKARDSHHRIFSGGKSPTPELIQSWNKSFVSDVNLRKYSEAEIVEDIQKLKEHLLKNPMAKLKVTFLDVNEADLYQLVKKKIFIVGVTDSFLSVDNNVLSPYSFLQHDIGHFYGFFGYSDRTALYDTKNKRSQDITEKIALWQQLDTRFANFENKVREGIGRGHIKHPESAMRFLFELNHEVSNSIYFRLERQYRNLLDEDTVREVIRMITGRKVDFLQHYENKEQILEIQSDLAWLLKQAQAIFVEPGV